MSKVVEKCRSPYAVRRLRIWVFGALQFSGSRRVNDALYPSKSGLINKHTVKHTLNFRSFAHRLVWFGRLSPD